MQNIDNLILEHLKRIQAEQAASRERDAEILGRLAQIEVALAHVARDESFNYSEIVHDRHTIDRL